MYGFVLLGLLLALVSMDLAGDVPPPDVWVAVSEAVAAATGVFLAGLAIAGYILRKRGALEVDEQRFLGRVARLGRLYRLAVLGAYAVVLFQVGWAPLAAQVQKELGWHLPAVALALAPLVVFQALAWTALYWADRALRAFMFERAGAGVAVRQWTLPRYLEFMFRQYLLVVLIPLLALVGIQDLLGYVLGPLEDQPLSALLLFGAVLGAAVLAGPWMRICWRTEPLPEGDLRDRLFALADRAGIRIGEVLVWRTNQSIANGCMVGVVGPFRYIMITDALLLAMSQAPEEVEAVFAHEVGHVKYRHTLFYMILAIGGMGAAFLALGATEMILASRLWAPPAAISGFGAALASGWVEALPGGAEPAMYAAMAAAVLLYWGFGFGFISRRCEFEADLYAVRATICPRACSPPDAGTVSGASAPHYGETEGGAAGAVGQGLCEHRVMVFVNALRRISRLNGAPETRRGWRHFSVARRCDLLLRLMANPADVAPYERRIRRSKAIALIAAFVLALAAAGIVLAPGNSETDRPEDPARPDNVFQPETVYCMGLVDRDEVDLLAFRAPEFDGQSDPVAYPDDRRLARLRRNASPADDDVAVQEPRRHTVSVDSQRERPRTDCAETRYFQVLGDPVGRGLG